MIRIKTEREIEYMKVAGEAVATALKEARKVVVEGASARDVENLVLKIYRELHVKPAFKGYRGYPYATCVSVNEEVIHGLPKRKKIFKSGDIVSIDTGAVYKGYYADAALTYIVGDIDERGRKLVETTYEALIEAKRFLKAGVRLGDLGYIIQRYVEERGFNVVREFVGHGIGRELHEEPQVPNYGKPGTGVVLRAGMTIAVEPMVTEGDYEVEIASDGWTVLTVDGSRSAHFEFTFLIKDDGVEVLTPWE